MAKEDKAPVVQKSQQIEKARPSGTVTPFEDMEKMFDQFFRRMWLSPFHWESPLFPEFHALPELMKARAPRVDVVERDSEVLVRAEVPGVGKDDLDISISEDSVTIRGKSRHEEKEEKGDYRRVEISRGEFSRTVYLPAGVDGSKAKAKFKDGILDLTLPKLKKSERHTVKIEEG